MTTYYELVLNHNPATNREVVMAVPNSNQPRRYFAVHYLILRFLGLGWWHHPDENDTRNFPSLYIYYSILTQVVWVAGFVGLETIDPFVGDKDLDRFMFCLSFVITHNLTLIKIYIFVVKNKEIQHIVRTLETDLRQFYQNDDKIRRTVKKTRILTGIFLFFGWLTIGNTNVSGIIQDIHWKAEVAKFNSSMPKPLRTLPQPIYIPWKYQTTESYISTFVLETVGLLWTGHIVMIIDTFIGSVILHMSSQFSMLYEAWITAYDRTLHKLLENINHVGNAFQVDDKYEDILNKYYTRKEIELNLENTFKTCVRQHQTLISCVENFAKTYSYGFLTQLMSSVCAICVVMVQISQDASSLLSVRLVTSLAFFAAMITQLATQCFTSTELTYQAYRISDAVMYCKWERMSPSLRRLQLMTMMRAQRPLRLNAAGFAIMDNACFLSIIKAAYSYYAVIN